MNKNKIQYVIGLLFIGLISLTFYLLSTIKSDSNNEKIKNSKFVPKLEIKSNKKIYNPFEKIKIDYEIKNSSDKPIFLNHTKDYYIIKKEKNRIYISQFFDEKYLKNPLKNIFIRNKSNIPGVIKIEKNGVYKNNISIELEKSGTYEIVFSTGYNALPRTNFLVVGATYEFTKLIDKFLEWQKYLESNKLTIFIKKGEKKEKKKRELEIEKKYRLAMSLNNLANKYISEKKYVEAEKLLQKSLMIIDNYFGKDNKDYAMILYNLGILYFYSNNIGEAEKYFNDSIIIFEKCYSSDSPKVIETKINLAKFYLKIGEKDKFGKIVGEQLKKIDSMKTISVQLNKLKKEMNQLIKKVDSETMKKLK